MHFNFIEIAGCRHLAWVGLKTGLGLGFGFGLV